MPLRSIEPGCVSRRSARRTSSSRQIGGCAPLTAPTSRRRVAPSEQGLSPLSGVDGALRSRHPRGRSSHELLDEALAGVAPGVGDGDGQPLLERLDLDTLDGDLLLEPLLQRALYEQLRRRRQRARVRAEEERLQATAEVGPVDALARAREEHLEDEVADVIVVSGHAGAPAAVEVEGDVEVAIAHSD